MGEQMSTVAAENLSLRGEYCRVRTDESEFSAGHRPDAAPQNIREAQQIIPRSVKATF
jgi:hypothetical protein